MKEDDEIIQEKNPRIYAIYIYISVSLMLSDCVLFIVQVKYNYTCSWFMFHGKSR